VGSKGSGGDIGTLNKAGNRRSLHRKIKEILKNVYGGLADED